jgi:uncharacterized protein with PQ loop repeat
MANLLSVIGYIGTGLVVGAYAPQISHLWTEHCSAGISERAYAIWALAAALFSRSFDRHRRYRVHGYAAGEHCRPGDHPGPRAAVP